MKCPLVTVFCAICAAFFLLAATGLSHSYRARGYASWATSEKGALGITWSRGRVLVDFGGRTDKTGIPIDQWGFEYGAYDPRSLDPASPLPDSWRLAPLFGGTVIRRRTYQTHFSLGGFAAQTGYSQLGIPMLDGPFIPQSPLAPFAQRLLFPFWSVLLITGVPLALWLSARIRRVRRRAAGRCVRCGYDLRASPSRCPECGHAAPHAGTQPGAPPAPTGVVQ